MGNRLSYIMCVITASIYSATPTPHTHTHLEFSSQLGHHMRQYATLPLSCKVGRLTGCCCHCLEALLQLMQCWQTRLCCCCRQAGCHCTKQRILWAACRQGLLYDIKITSFL